ncbi:sphingosine-1-phosphate phosphatase 2 isoform X1 [Bufo gargarizans]|uniref:sphingosine-1-phosphate phosphatase 2 isoform X1 n=2 Tax=Bufo gargarizans TaxID=30331 RepID=UPI001CF1AD94|nr:sphingosine-1-phosphate phosphatase 2 isoform X1 [Bufo gargarizans]
MALSLLETLQDPQLVARFQRFCGLTLKPKGEANGAAPGHSSEKTAGVKGVLQENGHMPYINGSYTNGTHRQGREKKYVVHNYLLYYLFRFAAALGQEIFYITFLPFTLWNIDSFIARRLIIVWCIVMYIGQASKDLLKWPRPSSPPVAKLETRVEAEYGMPSTHAIAATAISFTYLLAAMERYQFPFAFGFVAALFLSTLVSLSRLYTGMHTVLDVICGALIALLFLAVTFPLWDSVDHLILTSPICPVFSLVFGFLLSYNYPKLDHYSTTRADTTVILGVGAGTCVGTWILNLIGLTYVPSGPFPLGIPQITYPMLLKQLLRFVLGVALLVITRYFAKTLSLKALGSRYKVSTQDVLVRQRLEIEVPYKFVTYTSMGVVANSTVPWIYYLLNL